MTDNRTEIHTTGPVEVVSMFLRKASPTYQAKEAAKGVKSAQAFAGDTEVGMTIKLDESNPTDKHTIEVLKAHKKGAKNQILKTTYGGEALPKGQYVATFRNKISTDQGYESGRPQVGMKQSDGTHVVVSPCKANGYTNNIPGFSSKLGDKATAVVALKLTTAENGDTDYNGTYMKQVSIESLEQAPREESESIFNIAKSNLNKGTE